MTKILIVDDIKGWRDYHSYYIKEMFSDKCFIVTAESAKEGYDKLIENNNEPFDIILTDLQMEEDFEPKYAGEWFVEQIKTFKNIVIYHKINYNDDFNTNNRLQTPKNYKKFKRLFNSGINNLEHDNSLNQNNFRRKIIDEPHSKDSFPNSTLKKHKKIFSNNSQFSRILYNQSKVNNHKKV